MLEVYTIVVTIVSMGLILLFTLANRARASTAMKLRNITAGFDKDMHTVMRHNYLLNCMNEANTLIRNNDCSSSINIKVTEIDAALLGLKEVIKATGNSAGYRDEAVAKISSNVQRLKRLNNEDVRNRGYLTNSLAYLEEIDQEAMGEDADREELKVTIEVLTKLTGSLT